MTIIERAQSLWFDAQYSAALRELESAPPSGECFLLAARAAYALRRYDDALQHLAAGRDLFTGPIQVESDALEAVLAEIKNRPRESDASYARAAQGLARHPSGRAANMLALRAWMRDDIAESLRRLRLGEASTDANVRAQALSLRSWTLSSRGQFAEQARVLAQALRLALGAPVRDAGRIADMLQCLSARCRELHLPEEFELVCRAAEELSWTYELREQEYHTRRHIALNHAMQGDYVLGLRGLQRTRALSERPQRRALALLDSAWVALASSETNTAQAQLHDALEAIDECDWSDQHGAEAGILLLAAEIAFTFEPPRARALLDRYESLKASVPIQAGVRHDRSFDPIETYTRSRVLSISDVGPARKLAKQAYRRFVQMGFQWRAARCALFLYESGCGEKWLAAAREQAKAYPRSFIGAHLARIAHETSREPLSRLTPRQRDVVRLLLEGGTVHAVAAALKTSPGTVRVHLKHIHRVLGVRNRVELLRAVGGSA